MIEIKHHRITDEWKVELDGKTYWVTRCKSAGYQDTWTVQNLRVVNGRYGGEGEALRYCDSEGRTWKRVVSSMKEYLQLK
jgi:hypothetical protein